MSGFKKRVRSSEIGEWFRNEGISAITVSSVSMAEYFAIHGWDDITIAFTVNINEIKRINNLIQKIKINLLVDNTETLQCICEKIIQDVGILIKIDTGYHRTGIEWNNFNQINALITLIKSSPKLKFKGFLTHNGNTYTASSKEEIKNIFNSSRKKLLLLKSKYINEFSDIIISVGDTPSCSIMNEFSGIDEIRPGNFVFYDVMQYYLGSCNQEQIAVSVVCPVVSKNEDRCELVIYGGAVHFSKEYISDKNNNKIFGILAESSNNGWGNIIPYTKIISLTQEHGIIRTNKMFFNSTHIGDTVIVMPIHSCLSVNNFPKYLLTTGKWISKKKEYGSKSFPFSMGHH